jgi:hypothetical protein
LIWLVVKLEADAAAKEVASHMNWKKKPMDLPKPVRVSVRQPAIRVSFQCQNGADVLPEGERERERESERAREREREREIERERERVKYK